MCGILGVRRSFLSRRGQDDAAATRTVDAALATMAWRGPDDRRRVVAGDWWLGIARLTITDPASPQPIVDRASGRVVVLNGAFTSASAERAQIGAALQTGNDAELALHRLAAGPERLVATSGPYAFAIVDPLADVLWLGRDPCGEKPLYVVRDGEQVVAFASTVAALAALRIPVELEPESVARWFRFGFGAAVASRGGLTIDADLAGGFVQRAGEPLRPLPAPPVADGGPAEPPSDVAADLRARVLRAVDRCATAEVGVALSLSGGVDSACLAAAAAHFDRRLVGYQFRAIGAPADERERAQRVAAATGHELRAVDGGPEVLRALPMLTAAAGMPVGDPSALAVHAVARAAANDGHRVLLSGEGGDDLFLGYRRDRAARYLPRRPWPIPSVGHADGAWARIARALRADPPFDAMLEVTSPAFRAAVLATPEWREGRLPAGGFGSALQRAEHVERQHYLRHDLLPKLDLATMAAHVEGRCPLLDPEVVSSAAASEPPRLRLGKRRLREAFRADLPAGILELRKVGFGLPLDAWWRDDDYLPDLLLEPRTLERPHLRRDGVRAMLDRQRRGARLGHALFLLVAFELHLRAHAAASAGAAAAAG